MGVHCFTFAENRYQPCEEEWAFSIGFAYGEYRDFLTRIAVSAGLGEPYRQWSERCDEWCKRGFRSEPMPEPPTTSSADPMARLLWNKTGSLTPEDCRLLAPRLRELADGWAAQPGFLGPREKAFLLAEGLQMAALRGLNVGIGY